MRRRPGPAFAAGTAIAKAARTGPSHLACLQMVWIGVFIASSLA
jgi:hypothetical protein